MDELQSILLGTSGLALAAAVSLVIALRRSTPASSSTPRVRGVAVGAILLQVVHFSEELATHFFTRFPELFGLAPWPATFFVAFNLTWMILWVGSVAALPADRRILLFPLWFLGVASVANGVFHPLLALVTGGYFPGLWTSPLVGLAGFFLLRELGRSTHRLDRIVVDP